MNGPHLLIRSGKFSCRLGVLSVVSFRTEYSRQDLYTGSRNWRDLPRTLHLTVLGCSIRLCMALFTTPRGSNLEFELAHGSFQ